jgi:DNA repair protein RadC
MKRKQANMVFVSGMEKKLRTLPEIKLKFTTAGIEDFGKIQSSVDAVLFLRKIFSEDTLELQEQFLVVYLNRRSKVIGYYKLSTGGIGGTVADVRLILAAAIKSASSSIILAHNHPSGDTQPSPADLQLTKKIKEAALLMDMSVADHIILAKDSYYSFTDEGLLGNKNQTNKKHKAMTKLKNLGKIVDTGDVPKISNADEFWQQHKHPQIIFNPEDVHFRKGKTLPRTLVSLTKRPEKIPAYLKENYAIKGFEFGNWTTQEDRQNYMIGLAISLFDLEQILGFDPKYIGLKGILSIAFGSRGVPNTHGTFDPSTFVINLNRHHADDFKYMVDNRTRESYYRRAMLSGGLQSLGHEYGHALDFFCGTYIEPNSKKSLSGNDLPWNAAIRTDDYLARLMLVLMNKICFDDRGKASAYIKRLRKNKKKRKYLMQRSEIFARAFEKYLIYKMKRHGWHNVYFTKFKYDDGSDKTIAHNWYLTDIEFQNIEQEFDMLIKHIGSAIRSFKKKVPAKKGLGDLPEEKTNNENTSGAMSVEDARNAEFDLIGLTGDWLNVIGEACKPTDIFVYGEGGSGKTTFVLLFTQYLANKLNQKILYVAGEQYNTPTFKALLNRLNFSAGNNFKIVPGLEGHNLDEYDFIVLDSKDHVGIELPQFIEIKKRYPEQSFIILSQSTKAGNYTGTGKWRNVVDVMLHAQQGLIKQTGKNRWGGNGEMKVY